MALRKPPSNYSRPPLSPRSQKPNGAGSRYDPAPFFVSSIIALERCVPRHFVRVQHFPVDVERLQQGAVGMPERELRILQVNVGLNLVAFRTHFLLLELQQIVRRRHTHSEPHLLIMKRLASIVSRLRSRLRPLLVCIEIS